MSFFRTSAEKEQLITAHREVKEQAMQARLRHARELEEAKAAAEAKLDESLKEYTNNTAVMRAELEEQSNARKAAEHRIDLMTTDHREYDRLVMQIDALALSKPLSCPFFRLQAFSFR
jgi:t-SNARE complex subunit (syntaxin)